MKRVCIIFTASLLFVVALAGVVHSARATVAYTLYHRAKYGSARHDVPAILRLAERAHRLYRRNYYLCILAAEQANYAGVVADGADADRMLAVARFWIARGLDLNPYKRQLCLLNARLKAEDSPGDAVEFWAQYVDWHFWDPYNHAVLVELHAGAGQYAQAMSELKWVRGTVHFADAHRKLSEAWAREMASPSTP